MRLLFLGTGASQGYPALFCRCDNCAAARRLGGRNLRRRSALLVNDDLLIDFGPDLFAAALDFQLALFQVQYLLLTHAHGDHLLGKNFDYHRERWAQHDLPVIQIYGSEATLAHVGGLPWSAEELRVALHPVQAGQTWQMGPYRVTALPARHGEGQQPLFYVVQQGAAAFLYAADTGAFYPAVWDALERLRSEGMRLDAAIVEGTMGVRELSLTAAHMNFARCVEHHDQLRRRGLTRPGCLHLATHLAPGCQQVSSRPKPDSPYGAPPHDATAALLAPHGVAPAYDGQEIELRSEP
jgi:phosphoribosyl 1,2-cyclic phosphate phosphodiesterase